MHVLRQARPQIIVWSEKKYPGVLLGLHASISLPNLKPCRDDLDFLKLSSVIYSSRCKRTQIGAVLQ